MFKSSLYLVYPIPKTRIVDVFEGDGWGEWTRLEIPFEGPPQNMNGIPLKLETRVKILFQWMQIRKLKLIPHSFMVRG